MTNLLKRSGWVATGILAALLTLSGSAPMAVATPAAAQRLAQAALGSVSGQLTEDSQTLEDGSYYEVHTFTGTAGDIVAVELTSSDFDTYLILVGPTGETVAENDDSDGTNSRVVVQLLATGTYAVAVTTNEARAVGEYTLNWQPATPADQALQRATELNQQAIAAYRAGRFSEAEPLFQESLDTFRQLLGDRHLILAASLNNLAALYRPQGRYSEAEQLLQESLNILRQLLGDHHPDVATSLINLAGLYQAQSRYSEAEPLYKEALDIHHHLLGNHPDVASSLDNLASLYYIQGRYSEAEPLLQESLNIRYQLVGDRHPDVATSLNNLANLFQAQGRYSEAESLYQEALDILHGLHEQLSGRHPILAASLNNLAELYRVQGRYSEAELLYQEVLDIRRQQLDNRHPNVAESLNNLAALYQNQGRYNEAEPLYQEALNILRQLLGDRHPKMASSLNNLAGLYQAQGRFSEAEPLFKESLDISRQGLSDRHPNVATSLNNLALLYQAQGNTAQALAHLRQGLDIQEYHLETNLATLNEAQRQDYAATISGSTELTLSLNLQQAAGSTEAAQLALTTLLRRKGRILEAGISNLQALRQNLTPADQALLDQLAEARTQLAALLFNPPATLEPEQYQAEVARLEAIANESEATLARRSAVFRAEVQPVDLAAVQAALPANGVLVEFARYQPFDFTNSAERWGEARYAAYLLHPDGTLQAIDLGEAAAIDAAVQAFGQLLQNPDADLRGNNASIVAELDPEKVRAVSRSLRALVFDPLAPHLQGRQHLLISPDSQLNRLPFEALPTDDGQYLIEQYQISYLNTGRDLVKFGIVPASTNPAVVLANPDYDVAAGDVAADPTSSGSSRAVDSARSGDLGQFRVGPLAGTAAEAAAIAPLLPSATLLTEAQATETALKQVRAPQILHVATHGFFLADAPTAPVAASTSGSRAFGSASAPVENPLLRSGLALAGFNQRRSGSEDGVFTALEAASLSLVGTQLVVLSACDTGLGDIGSGEGVYGLRRAFSLAGAETQLISLWQVSDAGTQSLMTRYYQRLMGGMGRSEALRATQLEMIQRGDRYSHPYYWAAFILAGDWRSLEAP